MQPISVVDDPFADSSMNKHSRCGKLRHKSGHREKLYLLFTNKPMPPPPFIRRFCGIKLKLDNWYSELVSSFNHVSVTAKMVSKFVTGNSRVRMSSKLFDILRQFMCIIDRSLPDTGLQKSFSSSASIYLQV